MSDVSGVPVGVTLGQEPFSRALPGVTGLVSLPVPRKLATQRGRTAVAMYLFPARPGAAGTGCLKAHVPPGGLIGRDHRGAGGNQRCRAGMSAALQLGINRETLRPGVNFELVNDLLAGLLPADQTVDAVLTAFGNGPSPVPEELPQPAGGADGEPRAVMSWLRPA